MPNEYLGLGQPGNGSHPVAACHKSLVRYMAFRCDPMEDQADFAGVVEDQQKISYVYRSHKPKITVECGEIPV